ncbi:AAA family ATPase [Candidatus Nitrotoga sp. BS]|uniref:AAA family ATPase n=1 Tax=Candidatus Nitrotoga sp. BS TaxID=2890408 RepID=UPI001EF19C58|nr:AAA family ATPase [Candidatus Nitrotoga sp. BS]
MSKTQLNKLIIEKFRALDNVEIEFGDHITVICGKNGTSKSSILGIAAQIFNFEKDYIKDEALSFQQIAGGSFKSQYSEHFRISGKFDVPGSMTVNIELFDGYTNQPATATLQLDKRGKLPRPVVRKNSTAPTSDLASRNFTHPVIFLSLKRLFPIADRKYKTCDFNYLKQHKQEFIGLTNELLNRGSSHATGTDGTISSAVAHGDNYDHESVSAGEDNAGQIILALMSFRKLKEEYPDYKGGLLLIDEADAGLFPTAQVNLLKMLDRKCKSLNLQVVMTSHSPTLIEYAFEQSQKFRKKFKTVYLSNTFGTVQVMQDWSWVQISADINTKTVATISGTTLPNVNVYFEDKEAADFFAALMIRQPVKKFMTLMTEATLGCGNYLNLIKSKVPEFAEKGIICLDSDAAQMVKGKNFRTIVLLPGNLPPDQLIFEHLYNLPASHDFWKNDLQFTRDVFTNYAAEVIREFVISGKSVDVKEHLAAYRGDKTPREIFKRFYKDAEFQKLVTSGAKPHNPWKHWVENNPDASNAFLTKFKEAIHGVMKNGYAVDVAKLTALEVKFKKV